MKYKKRLLLVIFLLCNRSSLLCSQNEGLLREGYLQKDIDRWCWTSFVKISQNIQDVIYFGSENCNKNQWTIPLFDRLEFLKLDEECKKTPSEVESYYFPESIIISDGLRSFLENNKLGCKVKYKNGQSAFVRYNLNKKYLLYIIEKKVKSFEGQ